MTTETMTQADQLKAMAKAGVVRSLRQSLLNSADICLRRAQYDLAPPGPRRSSEAAIRGTGYHAAQETYYKWRQEGQPYVDDLAELIVPPAELMEKMLLASHNTIVHEIELYEAGLITWDTSPQGCIDTAAGMVEAYFEQGHQWGPEYVVLGTEVPFWLPSPYPGWVSHGTIDLVLEGPDPCDAFGPKGSEAPRGVLLDDHKTSGRKWDQKKHTVRKTAQVATYFEAWEQLTGVAPLAFSFSIVQKNGAFERRWVRPTDAEMAAFREKRDVYVEQLSSGRPLPFNTTSNLCSVKYCSHWDACPMGAAMDQ